MINKHWNCCKYLGYELCSFPAWRLFETGENAVAEKPVSKKETSVFKKYCDFFLL